MTLGLLRHASKYLFAGFDRLAGPPEGPRILIYHQVGSDLGRQMEVTIEDFRFQLELLADHYEVVDLETALDRWQEPGAERLVVLTFDDGYEDTFTTAYPLLSERGLPFTLYAATRQIEEQDVSYESRGAQSLNWDQVTEMLSSGLMTLGAHTHGHRDLRFLSADEVEAEVEASNELIEIRTGITPRHFAYPWGYWSETAHGVIADEYASAVLGGSTLRSRPLDRFRVPRFPVQRSDGNRFFRARLDGGLLLEESLRRRLRGYSGP